jgi:hypothetical protein
MDLCEEFDKDEILELLQHVFQKASDKTHKFPRDLSKDIHSKFIEHSKSECMNLLRSVIKFPSGISNNCDVFFLASTQSDFCLTISFSNMLDDSYGIIFLTRSKNDSNWTLSFLQFWNYRKTFEEAFKKAGQEAINKLMEEIVDRFHHVLLERRHGLF